MHQTNDRGRGNVPLLTGGALAALVLVLGVNGTLSAWTQAIITNSQNTTKLVNAVVLSESSGAAECSTAGETTNTFTCSSINKYGGTGQPLAPGGSHTEQVTLSNTGNGDGQLTLKADQCLKSGGLATSNLSLCDYVTATVACPTTVTLYGPGTLTAFAQMAAPTVISALPAGGSVACNITISVPEDAPSGIAGQEASQVLTWTLSGT